MRGLIGFVIGLSLAGFMAYACGGTPPARVVVNKHKVAMTRPGVKAQQAPSGLFVQSADVVSHRDGSQVITVEFSIGSAGVFSRNIKIDPDGKQVTDSSGLVLIGPAPPALVKAHAAYAAEVEKLVAAVADSGKAAP